MYTNLGWSLFFNFHIYDSLSFHFGHYYMKVIYIKCCHDYSTPSTITTGLKNRKIGLFCRFMSLIKIAHVK